MKAADEKQTLHCSIIVCTYNRCDILKNTLSELRNQIYHNEKLEIVVVDNGSTDDTREIVAAAQIDCRHRIKYVYEPQLGLSEARNRGVESSRGQIVIFIDDDAQPKSRDWVQRLTSAYSAPEVAAAGGQLQPVWPNNHRPEWLPEFLVHTLGLTKFRHSEIAELHYPYYPWGANISFWKESLKKLNGFSTELGRVGQNLICGEETELCLRLEKTGGKIVYVPDAQVDHLVTEEKLSEDWFRKRALCQGVTDAKIESTHYSKIRLTLSCFRRLANLVLHLGALWISVLAQSRKYTLLFEYKVKVAYAYLSHMLKSLLKFVGGNR